jgi:hypothetical protein
MNKRYAGDMAMGWSQICIAPDAYLDFLRCVVTLERAIS